MKNILVCMLLSIASFNVFSQEAMGTIDEIKICATGQETMGGWIRTLQFKIDGKWFGTYADQYGHHTGDVDNEMTTSIIYMAFSQNLSLRIRATDAWTETLQKCGVKQGAAFHGNAGDYIHIVR